MNTTQLLRSYDRDGLLEARAAENEQCSTLCHGEMESEADLSSRLLCISQDALRPLMAASICH